MNYSRPKSIKEISEKVYDSFVQKATNNKFKSIEDFLSGFVQGVELDDLYGDEFPDYVESHTGQFKNFDAFYNAALEFNNKSGFQT